MATGRKRVRPVAVDTSFQDEDDFRSMKFARVRKRTKAPTKLSGMNSVGNSVNSSISVAGSNCNIYAASSTAGSSSQGSGIYSRKGGGKVGDKFGKAKPKPFFLIGRDSERRKSIRKFPVRDRGSSNPKNLFKKNLSVEATPASKKGSAPSTSYGVRTPEFMKVKEDESILEEKRDRKRRRNKILSLRTAKGQPVMRGRIQLLLEEIKAGASQNQE